MWNGSGYEIHIVHRVEVPEEPLGDKAAGVYLGICVSATVAYPEEAVLYLGNTLKEDRKYFAQEEYQTEETDNPGNNAERARKKLSRRTENLRHKLSYEISEQCVEQDVGTVVVDDPSGVEENYWSHHGRKDCIIGVLVGLLT